MHQRMLMIVTLLLFAGASIGCESAATSGQEHARLDITAEMMAEACEWLEQQAEHPLIMAQAKEKWGDDCFMVREEYQKQVAMWEEVAFFGCGGC